MLLVLAPLPPPLPPSETLGTAALDELALRKLNVGFADPGSESKELNIISLKMEYHNK